MVTYGSRQAKYRFLCHQILSKRNITRYWLKYFCVNSNLEQLKSLYVYNSKTTLTLHQRMKLCKILCQTSKYIFSPYLFWCAACRTDFWPRRKLIFFFSYIWDAHVLNSRFILMNEELNKIILMSPGKLQFKI